jgi:RNA polymerase sigma-32 factor
MAEPPLKSDWPESGDDEAPEAIGDEEFVPELEPLPEGEAEEASERIERALVPQDPLRRYLAEIRRYPLLTPEQEHELAVRYREYGDLEAAYRLVTSNLRLVVMIARRYEKAFRNLFDLIQEGNIGLMEAVKKFDPYRGIRFPSYAVWWIRAYIIRYIMNNFRLVKVGTTQAQRRLFFNLGKEMERLQAEGFDPSPKLIAQRLDVKPDEVVEMQQRMSARDLSVDAPVGDDESASMLELLPSAERTPEETVAEAHDNKWLSEKIREFGATLTGKEKTIFERRLVAEEPSTLQEIGEMYGISRERVRQLEERLKKRLAAFLRGQMKGVDSIEVVPADSRANRRRAKRTRGS